MILLRMAFGGLDGLVGGALGSALNASIMTVALGQDGARRRALSTAPFGGMLGMVVGATWQALRNGKRQ